MFTSIGQVKMILVCFLGVWLENIKRQNIFSNHFDFLFDLELIMKEYWFKKPSKFSHKNIWRASVFNLLRNYILLYTWCATNLLWTVEKSFRLGTPHSVLVWVAVWHFLLYFKFSNGIKTWFPFVIAFSDNVGFRHPEVTLQTILDVSLGANQTKILTVLR